MIARVFPRKTAASPDDTYAFFDAPPLLTIQDDITEVHISIDFSYDLIKAEWLRTQWLSLGVPIKTGGPVFNLQTVADDRPFVPGKYIKKGYVITSRGCPNNCWFCKVGPLREIPIAEGWNVLDDNLLACSDRHIKDVFAMLKRQPEKPIFTGGLESKLLKPWHCDLLREVKAKRVYFAYDSPDKHEPLVAAGKMLIDHGFTVAIHALCCYVLIGYKGDTFDKATIRLTQTMQAGFMPYAMLYRDEQGKTDEQWRQFQREWLRPQIVANKMKTSHNHDSMV